MPHADVAVLGAGAAGLSLAHRLARTAPGARRVSTVLVDAPPGPLRPPSRTWCYWEQGTGPYDAALTAEWRRLRVHAPGDRPPVEDDIAPLRYKMLRSDDFEHLVARDLAHCDDVRRLRATVDTVVGDADGAEIRARTDEGRPVTVHARWVFDSRPLTRLPAARTTLLQHFHGWFVRTRRPVFDPDAVVLMDFRVPQPPRGLAFGYLLPTGRQEALVEYTEFSDAVLPRAAYERALHGYTRDVLRLGELEVTATETGVIPMTDARFPRRPAPSVFRIGAAGGATRPSTGYTFSAVQRQTRAVADALRDGRCPLPPPAHSARSRAMDAVLLRALASGRVDGAAFFTRLFTRVPMERLLRFLDGGTRLHEDLSVGIRTPVLPMLRCAAELPWLARTPHRAPASRTPTEETA
ncbi:lycopene cyclase family protein [Streptomyces sp. Amel2xC10]|uniref:lycopene cyclase family protein n=1 Tax=Streptomyces sp. Amel2xC10 TaxID=1305826 RepID=UPI000A08C80B|nr:lycopene cyclase family protein [Streptomyces sp. Amel2xC10]SMF73113.1 lycopene beta-cyclase [Streptomyces sp. Amel2xC10]